MSPYSEVSENYANTLQTIDNCNSRITKEKRNIAGKLHKEFGHTS